VWVERPMMSTFAAPVTTFFGSSTNRPVIPGGVGSVAIRALSDLCLGMGRLGNLSYRYLKPRRVWGFLLLLYIGGIRKRLHPECLFFRDARLAASPTLLSLLGYGGKTVPTF
jgi:hypothetical protein